MEPRSSTVSREVSWALDGTTIDATLVRPEGAGPFPGVIFVAGSGPTDRNGNSPLLPGTNGSAALLADALAAHGIASLRYDKRASGARAQQNMVGLAGRISMRTHADELAGAVDALARSGAVRSDRLFAVANSEGTLLALNYQLQEPAIPLAGLVLIAPPGRSVGALARAQLAAQQSEAPDAEAVMARYDRAIASFVAGDALSPDPTLPPAIQGLLNALTAPANLPFTRELWTCDGAALLHDVRIPTLVLIGKKYIQVDWRADGARLEEAAAGRDDVVFAYPDHANHVMKYEPLAREKLTAQVALRYNAADADLDPDATKIVLEWLARQTSR